MRLGRRVSAGLCALALIAALVAFPLRARAMSAVFPAAGFALTVTAFLNMAGIYPFSTSDTTTTFSEWTDNLQAVIQQYNETFPNSPLNSDTVKGFIYSGSIMLTHNTYVALRDFVLWVVDTFELKDNRTWVRVGSDTQGGYISVTHDVPPTVKELAEDGWLAFKRDDVPCFIAISGAEYVRAVVVVRNSGTSAAPKWYVGARFFTFLDPGSARIYYSWGVLNSDGSLNPNAGISSIRNWSTYEDSYTCSVTTGPFDSLAPFEFFSEPFASTEDAYRFIRNIAPGTNSTGMTVDTTTVSVPAELPDDMSGNELIGLSVAAPADTTIGTESNPAASAGTAQAVRQVIETGVMNKEKPIVRPVGVAIQDGVKIDTETGAVTVEPGTVTITESDISLSVGDYAIPSLSTVFPFSIPWDIVRIWQALDAEPRFPLQDFSMTLDVPWLFGDSPPTVRFGLDAFPEDVAAKMEDVALVVRYSLLLVACVGFLVFISKFIKF